MSGKIAILTVIYHETREHYDIAMRSLDSRPAGYETYAVVNKRLKGAEYPGDIIYFENNKNNLSRAWNKGLKRIFRDGFDYALVSGMDSEYVSTGDIEAMHLLLKSEPDYGIISANPGQYAGGLKSIEHGDGSFSMFMISKKTFKTIGDFDENFTPAYFEDNDYLERLWEYGFDPVMDQSMVYYHIGQGTVKNGDKVKKEYSSFMQKNLEYFKKKWGKVPDHLPEDITFS